MWFSIVCSASRCQRVTSSGGVRAESDAVCAAFSNATPPTIRTALTISRPQNCERNAPNLLAHYLYLWGTTVVQQAIETAWISASVRRTFVEVLVPAG